MSWAREDTKTTRTGCLASGGPSHYTVAVPSSLASSILHSVSHKQLSRHISICMPGSSVMRGVRARACSARRPRVRAPRAVSAATPVYRHLQFAGTPEVPRSPQGECCHQTPEWASVIYTRMYDTPKGQCISAGPYEHLRLTAPK